MSSRAGTRQIDKVEAGLLEFIPIIQSDCDAERRAEENVVKQRGYAIGCKRSPHSSEETTFQCSCRESKDAT